MAAACTVSEGLKKKLFSLSKEKDCTELSDWIKSLVNHMYWIAATSENEDANMTIAKWESVLNHIINKHTGHSTLFPSCQHGELEGIEKRKKWLKPGTKVFEKLEDIITSRQMKRDVPKLSSHHQTSALEGYHSVINHFAPKMIGFSYHGMLCRLQLAALHFNENSQRKQACTVDGTPRYSIVFPKFKKGEYTVRKVPVKCTYATEDGTIAENLNNDLLEAQIVAQAITELQEIQGPLLHVQNSNQVTDVSDLVKDVQTNIVEGEPAESHVIYYIDSNGSFTGALEKSYVDSSVQANDYEIERRSGRVPARKRVIPNKFRDYKNTSNDEGSDSDFDPHEYAKKVRPVKRARRISSTTVGNESSNDPDKSDVRPVKLFVKVRGVGRPRKNFLPATTAKGANISQECFAPQPSAEVERKFQEAIRLSEQEVEAELGKTYTETQRQSEGTSQDGEQMSEDVETKTDVSVVGKRGRGRPRGPFWKKCYKCPDCGKTFNQKANLRVHLIVHTRDRPFPCIEEGCGKSFRSNEGLRRHLLSHQGIKPFECDVCKKGFSSNVALIEHQSRHTNEKPYQCPHCDKRFRQVSCLRRHVTTHSNKQPYVCTICQRQFAQPAYLRSHMKVHTGEKPYKCEICDKRFAHQSDVKRHRTTHTGEKPYSCGKCQAKFSDISSKNRHEREHENSKRYTCHLCSDTFKRTGQLRSHLNRRHSHTFSVKIEKDPNNGTFSFKMGEEGDPSSVFVTQKRIMSVIKNLQNKGFKDMNIALVSLPEEMPGSQPDGANLGTDISQLDKEVDASVIEGEVGVPVTLHGVEVQGDDTSQTYITVNDYTETWNQSEKNDSTGPDFYQKVQIITEEGEKKEILVPYNPSHPDVNIEVAYSSTADQPADIVTLDTQQTATSHVTLETSHPDNIAIVTEHTENVSTSNIDEAALTELNEGEKIIAYPVGDKSLSDSENQYSVILDSNSSETVAVEDIIIDNSSIISLAETDSVANKQEHNATEHNPDLQSLQKQDQTEVTQIEESLVLEINEKEEPVANVSSVNNTNNLDEVVNSESADTSESPAGDKSNNSGGTVDYVVNPDFGSQDYYNWLSKFTELCKVVPMPLDVSLFQKISQVHKTLSDVMANPSGVVADRENFRVLMNISRELSTIINEHLVFVLENLNHDGKTEVDSSVAS